MTIFERIKQKANQAIQGVGSFIDRDKSIGGVQLAKGGLVNRVGDFFQGARQDAVTRNQGIRQNVNDYFQPSANGVRTRDVVREIPTALDRVLVDPLEGFYKQYQDTESILYPDKTPEQRYTKTPVYEPQTRGEKIGAGTYRNIVMPMVEGEASGINRVIGQGFNTIGNIPQVQYGTNVAKDYLGTKGTQLSQKVNPLKINKSDLLDVTTGKASPEQLAQYKKMVDLKDKGIPIKDILKSGERKVSPVITKLDDLLQQTKGLFKKAPQQETKLLSATSTQADDVVTSKTDDLFTALKENRGTIKASNKYNEQLLDPQGFIKKSVPDEIYQPLKKTVFDRLNTLKGEAVDFKNNYITKIQSLGDDFKIGSKKSELTQKYGEGLITDEQLIKEIGEEGAVQVKAADNIFREMYDEIIDMVNTNRQTDGMDIINKRADYYRHIGEMTEGDSQLSRMLSGGSGSNSPQSSSIFRSREGEKTTYDAVGGMINYLDKSARAGFTDRVAPIIGKMSGYLKKQGADATVTQYLDDFSNQILGTVDESNIPAIVDKAAAKIRSSRVVGNVSSTISQGLNIPLGANVSGKRNYLRGLFNKEAQAASKTSPFLKDRGFRVPTSLESKTTKKIVGKMGAILQDADQLATKSIWQGFYEKGKREGVDDLIQFADDQTKQITGGRGIGDFSKWQQTKLGQFLSPFTVEPQAQANKIIDLIGEKKYGILLSLMVTNFVVNEGYEKLGAGYRPLPDLINATKESIEYALGSDKKEQSNIKMVTTLMMEMLQLAPVANSIFGNIYAGAELTGLAGDEGLLPSSRDLGIRDSTRFNAGNLYGAPFKQGENITGNKAIDQILTTTARFTPGGNQFLKTAGALKAQKEGVVKGKSGTVLYEPSEGLFAKGRQLLFGKWADSEAKKLFDNEFNWGLTKKQTELYDSLPNPEAKTKYLKDVVPDNISDKRLDSILEGKSEDSSIISKEDVEFYLLADKTETERLEELLPKFDNMDGEELFTELAKGRRAVNGKQLISNKMIDYMYDREYISKDEKKALKAIKYDEIKDEFYYSRDYKDGSGSGRMTYKQALKAFKIDLPKFSTLKSISKLSSGSIASSQTSDEGEILLSNILKNQPKGKSGSSDLWF